MKIFKIALFVIRERPGLQFWSGPGFTQYFMLCLEYIANRHGVIVM